MTHRFHVINLEKRTDRWEQISSQLTQRSIQAVRIKALEPPPGSGKPGWLYCALSHIDLLEKSREQGLPRIIVLEDDTVFTDSFDRNFKPALAWLDSHADQWDLFNGNPSDISYVPDQPIRTVSSDPLLVSYEWGWMTNFIIYNRSSYDRIIALKDRYLHPTSEMTQNYYDHAYDRMLCASGLRCVAALPYITRQSEGFSDLEGKAVNYEPLIFDNGQEFMLRRLRETSQGESSR